MPSGASAIPNSLSGLQVQRLRERADRNQTKRLVHGLYSYPMMMLVLWLTTNCFREHPRLLWSALVIMAVALA